ncbi:MAG TPA: hypothetical protein VGA99_11520 [bacterium]
MHKFRIGFLLILMIAGASASHAGTTEWMSNSQLDSYSKSRMIGKLYGTEIDCKDSTSGPLLKIIHSAFPKGYKPLSGTKLFYRWHWLIVKSSDLSDAVTKKARKEKRHLKWRVIQRNSYVDAAGVKMTCAIVYR